jgi:hypothetical protein
MHKSLVIADHHLSARPRQAEEPGQVGQPDFQRQATKPGGDNDDGSNGHLVKDGGSDILNQIGDTRTGSESTPATLEGLPAELRYQILYDMPDVAALKALVLASPVFHEQYLLERHKVLLQALERTLGSVSVDARAVMLFSSLRQTGRELPEKVAKLCLNSCYAHSFKHCSIPELWRCSSEQLTDIARFYLEAIHPLMQYCPTAFLANRGPSTPSEVGALSNAERTRFLRSLYRFQLFCELFGQQGSINDVAENISGEGVLVMFFGIFNPWEAEEVACIVRLITAKYDQTFDATPRKSHEDQLLAGLGPFNQLLKTEDYKITSPMRPTEPIIARQAGVSIVECLTTDTQYMRRIEEEDDDDDDDDEGGVGQTSEHDRAEYDRAPLRFWDDDEDGPPLGWVILWRETYSNFFGDPVPPNLQDWGYVFWDRDRLIRTGGKDDIVRDRLAVSDDPRAFAWG